MNNPELEFLLKDPLALRILIDGYLTGALTPVSAAGFPVEPDARITELRFFSRMLETQSLRSRLIGDIGHTEYLLAKKILKTYETQFKGTPE